MMIGKVKIPGNILLAPMSNVTNLPFRLMCRKYGASMTYSEMMSSDAVIHGNARTFDRGKSCGNERPFGVQIFGNSPQTISSAALMIEENCNPDIIDLNCGCPAKLLTKDGFGSALLSSPETIHSIINELSETVSTPVTAKIRVLEDMEKTLKIAGLIEDAGASALTVHGRTQQQQYSGSPDIEYAKRIKEELSIPVIVNGDIVDEASAEQALDNTGCDGIMIGRAAMGNPFLFRRISHYLDTGKMLDFQDCEQRILDLREYFMLLEEHKLMHTINVRAHARWFTRGIRNGRHIRNRIAEAGNVDEMLLSIDDMCRDVWR
ncbi:MAG: tRNA dihydrouridine synthase DusB [Methanosarcinaceae archaeon]|nr:tRNA dihydrouridine synthase DusB [Methanosarcinaceae archaeon]